MNQANELPPKQGFRKLPAALLMVLIAVIGLRAAGFGTSARESQLGDMSAAQGSVILLREAAETRSLSIEIAWHPGMTVLEATRQAAVRSPDDWSNRWRGQAEMAFLESLGGIENQGMEGLNWQFEVNGSYAERGAGATPIESDDRVLWKLAPYE